MLELHDSDCTAVIYWKNNLLTNVNIVCWMLQNVVSPILSLYNSKQKEKVSLSIFYWIPEKCTTMKRYSKIFFSSLCCKETVIFTQLSRTHRAVYTLQKYKHIIPHINICIGFPIYENLQLKGQPSTGPGDVKMVKQLIPINTM